MRCFILLIVLLYVEPAVAQQDTFVVKSAATTITVLPERSWLYLNENNPMKVLYRGKHELGRVEFLGGIIQKQDSLYQLKATTGVEGVLIIYEKLRNGGERIVWSRTYKLFSRELPVVTLNGISNDSFIEKFTLIAIGQLYAHPRYSQDRYTITAYTICLSNSKTGQQDTLRASDGRLSKTMKQRIDSMDVRNKGGFLLFENIKARGPTGREVDLPPLRIYLTDEKIIRFGQ
jgi:hypothetical protein